MPVKAPEDVAIALLQPTIIATNAYLNDPITFTTDVRFEPETALREADVFSMVDRDQVDFAVIDLGASTPQIYSVETYIDAFSRDNFDKVFNNA